jgi:glycosyltransferase involved in cell wall biosynthesis
MMGTPSISIVLPVYNGERYLQAAIDSVRSQSYEDYELIVWDDHSRDGSSEIIAKNKDERVRSFASHRNLGLFGTLNLAIGEARGELLRLFSQDDVLRPHCLEAEARFHQQHPEVAMAHSLYDVIDESGEVTIPSGKPEQPAVFSTDFAAQMMFYHGCLPGNISNVSLKRSVFDRVGPFREDLVIAGDFEMWVRIAREHLLGYIDESLLFVRAHPDQLSNRRGSYVIAMQEEQPLYETLMSRLPAGICAYAKWYNVFRRYPMYFHHAVRSLMAGDFGNAKRAYSYVSNSQHTLLVILFWFSTANQAFYRMKPKFVGSEKAGLTPVPSGQF